MTGSRTVRLAIVWLGALLVIGCGAGGTSSAPAASTAVASPSARTSASVAEQRVDDLRFLVERLEAIHPNPFLDEGETRFRERVAAIEAEAATLTETGFLVAVMDLMGHRERDGHSGAWALAQSSALLEAWPLWLWDFPDGPRIVAARAPYDDLVGGRVIKVGHLDLAAASALVEPLVPRDNASTLRGNLPVFLLLPGILAELGVVAAGDPGLTVELPDGSTREVTPDPLPMDAYRDWVFGVYGSQYPTGLPPDPHGPPILRHRDEAFWSETLTDPDAIYVGYNFVARRTTAGRSLGDLVASVTDATTSSEKPVVLDLRNNPGGDNNTYGLLRKGVEDIARAAPGRVRLITGRSTFSAAGNFVTDLLVGPQRDGITLVGEAPGGGLDMYGDTKTVTLPNSGIVVLISARYHERAPGDDRLQIDPDVPVEVSWADYVAGRDPVLEAAARP